MKLSEIGEFELIQRIRGFLPPPHKPVILGIGDDAAAVRPSSESLIIITSDMFLEGIHFDYSFSTPFQIGFKALSVNISDIAAMGGIPIAALISIGISGDATVEEVDGIFDGIEEVARIYRVSIVGGDTCRSKDGLILSIALLGEVEAGLMVKRSGAKPGDAIFVTGTLGDSAIGLEILKKGSGLKVQGSEFLKERHLLPRPMVEEGRIIAKNKWATAMIDISDGLLSDLNHICDESGVEAEIYQEKIPLSLELREVAAKMKKDPLSYALRGGEDYELLFTVPKEKAEEVAMAEFRGRAFASLIGEVTQNERVLIDEYGKRHTFIPSGYDHFREPEKGNSKL